MYTKKIIILTILILSAVSPAFAEEIIIGGTAGWENIIQNNSRLVDTSSEKVLQLADSEYTPDASTEMLFHFNRNISDDRGLYSIKNDHNVTISGSVKKKGSGSAVFSGEGDFLELLPSETSAFAAGSGRLNDFSIEFWMNPARLSEGETIFLWTGAITTETETLQQNILCAVSGRSLFWEIQNLFLTPDLGSTKFNLKSSRSLIPKRWHHHMLRYNSTTGLLEYLIDGTPEDIVYTNAAKKETNEIYLPIIGTAKPSRFMIGRGYTGFIDELRITTAFSEPDLNKFSINSGTAATGILDLQYYDSRFYQLDSKSETNGLTQIYYYYRISNKYFLPDAEYPGWNQINTGEILPPEVKGRYLQIMTELLPDGTGDQTPELSELVINYDKNLPPLPPAYSSANPGNEKAVISWQPVNDSDIAGYKVYYGDKPGLYFGSDAVTGRSPIDAGDNLSIEIDGLKNGKIYYFAVTSYDNAEIPHESIFSKEISARPSAITKD